MTDKCNLCKGGGKQYPVNFAGNAIHVCHDCHEALKENKIMKTKQIVQEKPKPVEDRASKKLIELERSIQMNKRRKSIADRKKTHAERFAAKHKNTNKQTKQQVFNW